MSKQKQFLVTTGNKKGIGLEISFKAFNDNTDKNTIIIFCDETELKNYCQQTSNDFTKLKIINSLSQGLEAKTYFYVKDRSSPYEWFKTAVDYASDNPKETAVVTGPMSKDQFVNSKINGHTSYLKENFKDSNLFMTFLGDIYNCLLLTDHTPLSNVTDTLLQDRLTKALDLLATLEDIFSFKKPIGVLGFNPHAGENGKIGLTEEHIHKKILKKFKTTLKEQIHKKNFDSHKDECLRVLGPLPADSFFSKETYESFSLLIANYHDQGLIPFKLLHGFNGCQTTLGLPFVRTSVNHGTGVDLYNRNCATTTSILEAYSTAKTLLNRSESL
jgi:4-hydroxythreonine-4-phosphate dehydrogenase